ncbi:hypothetical protein K4F52_006345 [Lecanicillium sp. MT-2017a]|nr:hypothetical protein K4F52_006345 [Lecanicillium sp. MT-2017a]
MLFPEEDAPQLKAWIVKRIENTSDADSDVLADYVIALLKHDGDKESVRKLCEDEIPDFLTEEPKAFLDDVFQAITYQSYKPGAPPAPKLGSTNANNAPSQPNQTSAQNNSRKRGYDDSSNAGDVGASGYGQEQQPHGGGRAHKQPRRGGRRGGRDDRQHMGYMPPGGMPDMPPFDPNNPMEAFMRMQAMGMPFPGMPEYFGPGRGGGGNRRQQRRRGRCRDFDTKGYCARGSTCMFEHELGDPSQGDDDYDPSEVMNMRMPGMPFLRQGPGNNRGGKRGRGNKKGGGSRAPFSADGPVHDRSKSTIVVERIPEENFSEEQVRGFFDQFGAIENVSMQPYKHLAIVKYDGWNAANAAYQSTKAIFDNRFVKVFWYKEEGDKPVGRSGPGKHANGENEDVDMQTEPEMDPEEFQRRQEEAQKQHQEREAKRSELELKRQELEKQQQDLLAKHREETERLQAKLAAKSAEGSTDADGGAAGSNGNGTGTEMLRAKLALLEQEAKILGIDPNAAEDDAGSSASGGGFRGGYRGRGYRGRGGVGGYAPRGRGSFRGSGPRHAAYAQYSIDNRPKKLAISGADFTAPDKDEALRHFLLNTGEFESIEPGTQSTYVSFQDRKTAEKFYFGLQGKGLPGVDANLELSWVQGASAAPTPAVKNAPADQTGDVAAEAAGSTTMAGTEDSGAVGGSAPVAKEEDRRVVDMDYEMPDEEAW